MGLNAIYSCIEDEMEVEDKRTDGILQRIKQNAFVQKLKGVKNIRIIAVVFIIAIALIIYSTIATFGTQKSEEQTATQSLQNDEEARLSAILSTLEGAGEVQTMITKSDGNITGVLIVADGAKNPTTRLRLMRACASALGISEDIICVQSKQNQ